MNTSFFVFNTFSDIAESARTLLTLSKNGQMDAASPWQLSFSDPATPIMEGIINFHNDLMFFIVVITIFVLWMLTRCVMIFIAPTGEEQLGWSNQVGALGQSAKDSNVRIINTDINNESKQALHSAQLYSSGINHHTPIEIAWTVTPALILMLIAVPSFALLYAIEEIVEPSVNLKITGHQWYCGYEYSYICHSNLQKYLPPKFESYMVPTADLVKGQLRLLEVDHQLLLPVKTHWGSDVTSLDVLHSWAVPGLGIKVDACPGRLNGVSSYILRESTFFGQCSEICGVNHGFMPIVVKSLPVDVFFNVIKADFLIRATKENIYDLDLGEE
jgi:cytochrome c oxidase subunit 2